MSVIGLYVYPVAIDTIANFRFSRSLMRRTVDRMQITATTIDNTARQSGGPRRRAAELLGGE